MGYINNINSTCGNRLSYKKYQWEQCLWKMMFAANLFIWN